MLRKKEVKPRLTDDAKKLQIADVFDLGMDFPWKSKVGFRTTKN